MSNSWNLATSNSRPLDSSGSNSDNKHVEPCPTMDNCGDEQIVYSPEMSGNVANAEGFEVGAHEQCGGDLELEGGEENIWQNFMQPNYSTVPTDPPIAQHVNTFEGGGGADVEDQLLREAKEKRDIIARYAKLDISEPSSMEFLNGLKSLMVMQDEQEGETKIPNVNANASSYSMQSQQQQNSPHSNNLEQQQQQQQPQQPQQQHTLQPQYFLQQQQQQQQQQFKDDGQLATSSPNLRKGRHTSSSSSNSVSSNSSSDSSDSDGSNTSDGTSSTSSNNNNNSNNNSNNNNNNNIDINHTTNSNNLNLNNNNNNSGSSSSRSFKSAVNSPHNHNDSDGSDGHYSRASSHSDQDQDQDQETNNAPLSVGLLYERPRLLPTSSCNDYGQKSANNTSYNPLASYSPPLSASGTTTTSPSSDETDGDDNSFRNKNHKSHPKHKILKKRRAVKANSKDKNDNNNPEDGKIWQQQKYALERLSIKGEIATQVQKSTVKRLSQYSCISSEENTNNDNLSGNDTPGSRWHRGRRIHSSHCELEKLSLDLRVSSNKASSTESDTSCSNDVSAQKIMTEKLSPKTKPVAIDETTMATKQQTLKKLSSRLSTVSSCSSASSRCSVKSHEKSASNPPLQIPPSLMELDEASLAEMQVKTPPITPPEQLMAETSSGPFDQYASVEELLLLQNMPNACRTQKYQSIESHLCGRGPILERFKFMKYSEGSTRGHGFTRIEFNTPQQSGQVQGQQYMEIRGDMQLDAAGYNQIVRELAALHERVNQCAREGREADPDVLINIDRRLREFNNYRIQGAARAEQKQQQELEHQRAEKERIELAKNNTMPPQQVRVLHPNSTSTASTCSFSKLNLPEDELERYLHEIEEITRVPTLCRPTKEDKVSLANFKNLRVLGHGAYGRVFLVQKIGGNDHNKLYAMKVLKKESVCFKKKTAEHAANERLVLELVGTEHPYLVSMHYAFQTDAKLYMVLDYVPGGELFSYLFNASRFEEDLVRLYIAQVVLALEHLHKLGVAYRDIKLENILMDQSGHIVITDYGLSKIFKPGGFERTDSFCGTLEYMAPEILSVSAFGHDKSVDWWSVGVLTYELLTGTSPFASSNPALINQSEISRKINEWSIDKIPDIYSDEVRDFIDKMLTKDPVQRLGGNGRGAAEIRAHPFFKKTDWYELGRKMRGSHQSSSSSPYYPEKDIADDNEENYDDIPSDAESLSTRNYKLFRGFSYVAQKHMKTNNNDKPEKFFKYFVEYCHAPLVNPPDWPPNLLISELQGSGAFGELYLVYASENPELKYVAKAVPAHLYRPSEIDGLQSANRNNHPAIVQFIKAFRKDNNIMILMEYLDGPELAMVSGDGLDILVCHEIFSQICQGLHHIQQGHFVHGDIKPENIVYADNEMVTVKIVDFGNACYSWSKTFWHDEPRYTLEYAPPEALEHSKYSLYSFAFDIWSLGCTLYRIYVGHTPFRESHEDDPSKEDLRDRILNNDFFKNNLRWMEAPNSFKDLVERCLIKDWKERITLQAILCHPWVQGLDEMEDEEIEDLYVEENSTPASPEDNNEYGPASPVDNNEYGPASPVDNNENGPASPVDNNEYGPASPADKNEYGPASPVDNNEYGPASPAAMSDQAEDEHKLQTIEKNEDDNYHCTNSPHNEEIASENAVNTPQGTLPQHLTLADPSRVTSDDEDEYDGDNHSAASGQSNFSPLKIYDSDPEEAANNANERVEGSPYKATAYEPISSPEPQEETATDGFCGLTRENVKYLDQVNEANDASDAPKPSTLGNVEYEDITMSEQDDLQETPEYAQPQHQEYVQPTSESQVQVQVQAEAEAPPSYMQIYGEVLEIQSTVPSDAHNLNNNNQAGDNVISVTHPYQTFVQNPLTMESNLLTAEQHAVTIEDVINNESHINVCHAATPPPTQIIAMNDDESHEVKTHVETEDAGTNAFINEEMVQNEHQVGGNAEMQVEPCFYTGEDGPQNLFGTVDSISDHLAEATNAGILETEQMLSNITKRKHRHEHNSNERIIMMVDLTTNSSESNEPHNCIEILPFVIKQEPEIEQAIIEKQNDDDGDDNDNDGEDDDDGNGDDNDNDDEENECMQNMQKFASSSPVMIPSQNSHSENSLYRIFEDLSDEDESQEAVQQLTKPPDCTAEVVVTDMLKNTECDALDTLDTIEKNVAINVASGENTFENECLVDNKESENPTDVQNKQMNFDVISSMESAVTHDEEFKRNEMISGHRLSEDSSSQVDLNTTFTINRDDDVQQHMLAQTCIFEDITQEEEAMNLSTSTLEKSMDMEELVVEDEEWSDKAQAESQERTSTSYEHVNADEEWSDKVNAEVADHTESQERTSISYEHVNADAKWSDKVNADLADHTESQERTSISYEHVNAEEEWSDKVEAEVADHTESQERTSISYEHVNADEEWSDKVEAEVADHTESQERTSTSYEHVNADEEWSDKAQAESQERPSTSYEHVNANEEWSDKAQAEVADHTESQERTSISYEHVNADEEWSDKVNAEVADHTESQERTSTSYEHENADEEWSDKAQAESQERPSTSYEHVNAVEEWSDKVNAEVADHTESQERTSISYEHENADEEWSDKAQAEVADHTESQERTSTSYEHENADEEWSDKAQAESQERPSTSYEHVNAVEEWSDKVNAEVADHTESQERTSISYDHVNADEEWSDKAQAEVADHTESQESFDHNEEYRIPVSQLHDQQYVHEVEIGNSSPISSHLSENKTDVNQLENEASTSFFAITSQPEQFVASERTSDLVSFEPPTDLSSRSVLQEDIPTGLVEQRSDFSDSLTQSDDGAEPLQEGVSELEAMEAALDLSPRCEATSTVLVEHKSAFHEPSPHTDKLAQLLEIGAFELEAMEPTTHENSQSELEEVIPMVCIQPRSPVCDPGAPSDDLRESFEEDASELENTEQAADSSCQYEDIPAILIEQRSDHLDSSVKSADSSVPLEGAVFELQAMDMPTCEKLPSMSEEVIPTVLNEPKSPLYDPAAHSDDLEESFEEDSYELEHLEVSMDAKSQSILEEEIPAVLIEQKSSLHDSEAQSGDLAKTIEESDFEREPIEQAMDENWQSKSREDIPTELVEQELPFLDPSEHTREIAEPVAENDAELDSMELVTDQYEDIPAVFVQQKSPICINPPNTDDIANPLEEGLFDLESMEPIENSQNTSEEVIPTVLLDNQSPLLDPLADHVDVPESLEQSVLELEPLEPASDLSSQNEGTLDVSIEQNSSLGLSSAHTDIEYTEPIEEVASELEAVEPANDENLQSMPEENKPADLNEQKSPPRAPSVDIEKFSDPMEEGTSELAMEPATDLSSQSVFQEDSSTVFIEHNSLLHDDSNDFAEPLEERASDGNSTTILEENAAAILIQAELPLRDSFANSERISDSLEAGALEQQPVHPVLVEDELATVLNNQKSPSCEAAVHIDDHAQPLDLGSPELEPIEPEKDEQTQLISEKDKPKVSLEQEPPFLDSSVHTDDIAESLEESSSQQEPMEPPTDVNSQSVLQEDMPKILMEPETLLVDLPARTNDYAKPLEEDDSELEASVPTTDENSKSMLEESSATVLTQKELPLPDSHALSEHTSDPLEDDAIDEKSQTMSLKDKPKVKMEQEPSILNPAVHTDNNFELEPVHPTPNENSDCFSADELATVLINEKSSSCEAAVHSGDLAKPLEESFPEVEPIEPATDEQTQLMSEKDMPMVLKEQEPPLLDLSNGVEESLERGSAELEPMEPPKDLSSQSVLQENMPTVFTEPKALLDDLSTSTIDLAEHSAEGDSESWQTMSEEIESHDENSKKSDRCSSVNDHTQSVLNELWLEVKSMGEKITREDFEAEIRSQMTSLPDNTQHFEDITQPTCSKNDPITIDREMDAVARNNEGSEDILSKESQGMDEKSAGISTASQEFERELETMTDEVISQDMQKEKSQEIKNIAVKEQQDIVCRPSNESKKTQKITKKSNNSVKTIKKPKTKTVSCALANNIIEIEEEDIHSREIAESLEREMAILKKSIIIEDKSKPYEKTFTKEEDEDFERKIFELIEDSANLNESPVQKSSFKRKTISKNNLIAPPAKMKKNPSLERPEINVPNTLASVKEMQVEMEADTSVSCNEEDDDEDTDVCSESRYVSSLDESDFSCNGSCLEETDESMELKAQAKVNGGKYCEEKPTLVTTRDGKKFQENEADESQESQKKKTLYHYTLKIPAEGFEEELSQEFIAAGCKAADKIISQSPVQPKEEERRSRSQSPVGSDVSASFEISYEEVDEDCDSKTLDEPTVYEPPSRIVIPTTGKSPVEQLILILPITGQDKDNFDGAKLSRELRSALRIKLEHEPDALKSEPVVLPTHVRKPETKNMATTTFDTKISEPPAILADKPIITDVQIIKRPNPDYVTTNKFSMLPTVQFPNNSTFSGFNLPKSPAQAVEMLPIDKQKVVNYDQLAIDPSSQVSILPMEDKSSNPSVLPPLGGFASEIKSDTLKDYVDYNDLSKQFQGLNVAGAARLFSRPKKDDSDDSDGNTDFWKLAVQGRLSEVVRRRKRKLSAFNSWSTFEHHWTQRKVQDIQSNSESDSSTETNIDNDDALFDIKKKALHRFRMNQRLANDVPETEDNPFTLLKNPVLRELSTSFKFCHPEKKMTALRMSENNRITSKNVNLCSIPKPSQSAKVEFTLPKLTPPAKLKLPTSSAMPAPNNVSMGQKHATRTTSFKFSHPEKVTTTLRLSESDRITSKNVNLCSIPKPSHSAKVEFTLPKLTPPAKLKLPTSSAMPAPNNVSMGQKLATRTTSFKFSHPEKVTTSLRLSESDRITSKNVNLCSIPKPSQSGKVEFTLPKLTPPPKLKLPTSSAMPVCTDQKTSARATSVQFRGPIKSFEKSVETKAVATKNEAIGQCKTNRMDYDDVPCCSKNMQYFSEMKATEEKTARQANIVKPSVFKTVTKTSGPSLTVASTRVSGSAKIPESFSTVAPVSATLSSGSSVSLAPTRKSVFVTASASVPSSSVAPATVLPSAVGPASGSCSSVAPASVLAPKRKSTFATASASVPPSASAFAYDKKSVSVANDGRFYDLPNGSEYHPYYMEIQKVLALGEGNTSFTSDNLKIKAANECITKDINEAKTAPPPTPKPPPPLVEPKEQTSARASLAETVRSTRQKIGEIQQNSARNGKNGGNMVEAVKEAVTNLVRDVVTDIVVSKQTKPPAVGVKVLLATAKFAAAGGKIVEKNVFKCSIPHTFATEERLVTVLEHNLGICLQTIVRDVLPGENTDNLVLIHTIDPQVNAHIELNRSKDPGLSSNTQIENKTKHPVVSSTKTDDPSKRHDLSSWFIPMRASTEKTPLPIPSKVPLDSKAKITSKVEVESARPVAAAHPIKAVGPPIAVASKGASAPPKNHLYTHPIKAVNPSVAVASKVAAGPPKAVAPLKAVAPSVAVAAPPKKGVAVSRPAAAAHPRALETIKAVAPPVVVASKGASAPLKLVASKVAVAAPESVARLVAVAQVKKTDAGVQTPDELCANAKRERPAGIEKVETGTQSSPSIAFPKPRRVYRKTLKTISEQSVDASADHPEVGAATVVEGAAAKRPKIPSDSGFQTAYLLSNICNTRETLLEKLDALEKRLQEPPLPSETSAPVVVTPLPAKTAIVRKPRMTKKTAKEKEAAVLETEAVENTAGEEDDKTLKYWPVMVDDVSSKRSTLVLELNGKRLVMDPKTLLDINKVRAGKMLVLYSGGRIHDVPEDYRAFIVKRARWLARRDELLHYKNSNEKPPNYLIAEGDIMDMKEDVLANKSEQMRLEKLGVELDKRVELEMQRREEDIRKAEERIRRDEMKKEAQRRKKEEKQQKLDFKKMEKHRISQEKRLAEQQLRRKKVKSDEAGSKKTPRMRKNAKDANADKLSTGKQKKTLCTVELYDTPAAQERAIDEAYDISHLSPRRMAQRKKVSLMLREQFKGTIIGKLFDSDFSDDCQQQDTQTKVVSISDDHDEHSSGTITPPNICSPLQRSVKDKNKSNLESVDFMKLENLQTNIRESEDFIGSIMSKNHEFLDKEKHQAKVHNASRSHRRNSYHPFKCRQVLKDRRFSTFDSDAEEFEGFGPVNVGLAGQRLNALNLQIDIPTKPSDVSVYQDMQEDAEKQGTLECDAINEDVIKRKRGILRLASPKKTVHFKECPTTPRSEFHVRKLVDLANDMCTGSNSVMMPKKAKTTTTSNINNNNNNNEKTIKRTVSFADEPISKAITTTPTTSTLHKSISPFATLASITAIVAGTNVPNQNNNNNNMKNIINNNNQNNNNNNNNNDNNNKNNGMDMKKTGRVRKIPMTPTTRSGSSIQKSPKKRYLSVLTKAQKKFMGTDNLIDVARAAAQKPSADMDAPQANGINANDCSELPTSSRPQQTKDTDNKDSDEKIPRQTARRGRRRKLC